MTTEHARRRSLPPGWSWKRMSANSDWATLARLDAQIYPEPDRLSPDEYVEYASRGNDSWLLMDDNGRWIGNLQVASGVPKPLAEPADDPPRIPHGSLYISGISVFQEHQGRGFGHLVVQRLIDEYGDHVLTARTRSDNFRAQRLLSRHGFRHHDTQRKAGVVWLWYRRDPLTPD